MGRPTSRWGSEGLLWKLTVLLEWELSSSPQQNRPTSGAVKLKPAKETEDRHLIQPLESLA